MATLVRKIGTLITMTGAWKKSGRHVDEFDLGIINNAAMVVVRDRIVWLGPEKNLKTNNLKDSLSGKQIKITKEILCDQKTVLPGWIDAHTHTVFGGHRHVEFEQRCQGATYLEIAQKGGGILSTVKATRSLSKIDLLKISQNRVNEFLKQGVSTLEIKSGYSLDLKNEIKQLEVTQSLVGPRIVTTFLGAHAKPPEFATHKDYLHYLSTKVLPIIQKKKLSTRVDIFVEKNFFEIENALEYLTLAKKLGFHITVHADQLTLSGGTQLAVRLNALSADHVIQISKKEIKALAESETTAILLPLADLYMKCDYPPARKLIEAGARVALASDFNPGSCPSQDLQLVGLLARLKMKMSLPEILTAFTINAAKALNLKQIGSLQPGFSADFQIIDRNWDELFYQAGSRPTQALYLNGKLIYKS